MGRGPGVRAASETSIQIDFRYKGVRCRERIALSPTSANLKYAKRLKATIDHEIAIGTFDYAKHFPRSPRRFGASGVSTSVRSALLSYCNGLAEQLEPETVDEYRHDAEIVAAGLGKDKTLAGITAQEIRLWVSTLKLSKKRIDNLLIPLRGTFAQALEDGHIKTNPLQGFKVRRVEAPKETIDPFTPDEIGRLGNGDLGELWKFWAWTGFRSGEIIGLEWEHVSSDYSSIHVRQSVRVGREKQPKTRAGTRTLQVLPAAQDALRAAAGQNEREHLSGPIWRNPNTGQRWHEDRGLARAFRKACDSAKVRYRYPYQLRHTFATWALSSGENPSWIAKQMGHSDTMMLFRVYGKWMPSLDPDAGSKMVRATKSKAA